MVWLGWVVDRGIGSIDAEDESTVGSASDSGGEQDGAGILTFLFTGALRSFVFICPSDCSFDCSFEDRTKDIGAPASALQLVEEGQCFFDLIVGIRTKFVDAEGHTMYCTGKEARRVTGGGRDVQVDCGLSRTGWWRCDLDQL